MDLTLSQVLKSPTITLTVGSPDLKEEVYHVHEYVLIGASHYFKRLLNSGFVENSQKSVVLSTTVDTPEACELFLEFAYKGKCEPLEGSNALLRCGKAYLFAEKIQATTFKEYIYEQAKAEAEKKFRELGFSFKPFKPAELLSQRRVEMLETWALLIEMIYQGTYDNTDELLSAEAPSDATISFKEHTLNMKSWLNISNLDSFRGLLSQICAQYPLVIACSPRILKLTRSLPDFAADVLNQQLISSLVEHGRAPVFAVDEEEKLFWLGKPPR